MLLRGKNNFLCVDINTSHCNKVSTAHCKCVNSTIEHNTKANELSLSLLVLSLITVCLWSL